MSFTQLMINELRAEIDEQRRRAERAEGERDEARAWAERLTAESRVLTCVYCGRAYPPGTPIYDADVLAAHVVVCEKHPMRAVCEERDRLRMMLEAVRHQEAAEKSGAEAHRKNLSRSVPDFFVDVEESWEHGWDVSEAFVRAGKYSELLMHNQEVEGAFGRFTEDARRVFEEISEVLREAGVEDSIESLSQVPASVEVLARRGEALREEVARLTKRLTESLAECERLEEQITSPRRDRRAEDVAGKKGS